MAEFADWKKQRTNEYTLENVYILVIDKKVFQIESFFVAEIDTFTAIGAGQDFALAALYLGHSPKEAVQIACELSVMCEPPIKEYIIER
jgi:ATP-dependent protease HslVU (ClpYQ) peptidase subunit